MPFSVKPTTDSRRPYKSTTAAWRILLFALSCLLVCTASTVAVSQQQFGFPADEAVPWAPNSGMNSGQQTEASYSDAASSDARFQPGAVQQASATGYPQHLPRTRPESQNTGQTGSPLPQTSVNTRTLLIGGFSSGIGNTGARSPVFGAENRLASQVSGLPTDRLPVGAEAGNGNGPNSIATSDAGFNPASLSGSAGEMISFSYLDGSGRQILTVIHTGKAWMAVYHIDRSGVIHLVSSREIGPDFGLLLNATSPLPDEIRQLGSPAR